MTPDRSEDPLADELLGEPTGPPLTAEEEAAIRGLLAVLPDPELPADVRARIVAAAAATGTAAGPAVPSLTEPATGPRAAAGHARPRPTRRGAWLLQSAAVLVVLALLGAVVVGFVAGRDDDPVDPLVAAAPATAGPVTSSGRTYDAATLAGQVRGLLVSATRPPSPEVATAAPSAPSSPARTEPPQGQALSLSAGSVGGEGGDTASGGGRSDAATGTKAPSAAAEAIGIRALTRNPVALQSCLDRLAGTTGALALTVDAGTFEGRPAAVIVLPDPADPARVAAWVVGPTCSDRDVPFPYRFERVLRP